MRLSRADWTEAALTALVDDGLTGVAVEPLARKLGVTKGSFYWHFADRNELITATLELWERRETTEVIAVIQAIEDPRERLVALGRGATAGAARGNAHAGVVAAGANPYVAPVLGRVTRARLAFLEQLYCDLGFASSDAISHARLAYALYLGIGEVHRVDPHGDPEGEALETYLDLAVRIVLPATAVIEG